MVELTKTNPFLALVLILIGLGVGAVARWLS